MCSGYLLVKALNLISLPCKNHLPSSFRLCVAEIRSLGAVFMDRHGRQYPEISVAQCRSAHAAGRAGGGNFVAPYHIFCSGVRPVRIG